MGLFRAKLRGMSALPHAFQEAVASRFPEGFLSVDPADLQEYGRDWTKVYTPRPSAIAFPKSTGDVAALLALCHAHRVPVVPSGGRTGLAGGAVAANGELVLSLSRMNRIEDIDVYGNTVRVQAGVVTEALHHACAKLGLFWPVDFASKGSSMVGGNIATNAGGVKVIRYGLTRQWVLGLQVVTAQGHVLELNGALEKNNTGLDLRQLFIGSEGTLGVITEATLKLCPLPWTQQVMLFSLRDMAKVLALLQKARQAPFLLSAFEFFTDKCLARLMRHRGLRLPFEKEAPFYALLEVEEESSAPVEDFMGALFEQGLVEDGTLSQSLQQARELWTYREGISESLAATGLPHKNDIALPIARLEAFTSELMALLPQHYPDWEVCLFGHVGDGNLHVNLMKPASMEKEAFFKLTKQWDEDMFERVKKHEGSISAEHGIGLLKKPYLSYSRSAEERALMRAVKRALDPAGILNPGKVLDP